MEDNGSEQKIKERIKQATKVIKKIFSVKLLVIILVCIIMAHFISSIGWYILKEDGTWDEDEEGNPNTYTNAVKADAKNGIVANKDELVDQGLKNLKISDDEIANMTEQEIIDKLQLSKKLKRTINSLDECTTAEILWCSSDVYSEYLNEPKQLEYLLNAELITQYPYIDGLEDGKLNGTIKFYRYSNTGDVDFKTTYVNNEEENENENENESEESQENEQEEIDASKIFYIGDSWVEGLETYGYVKSENAWHASGKAPTYVSGKFEKIKNKIPSDTTTIVLMLGLNGTDENQTKAMQQLIDKINLNYLDKQLYVLKVPHVGDGYSSAESKNSSIDTFNDAISEHCDSKSNVLFVDTVTVLQNGQGYLADKYKVKDNIHLNIDGYNVWCDAILSALNAGGALKEQVTSQEKYRLKYIEEEEFNALFDEYESSGKRDVFSYFTVDGEGNAVVATWTKVTGTFTTTGERTIGEVQSMYDARYQQTGSGIGFTEYSASRTNINYKSMSEKYTMPFEYLWALMVMTEDYDFVERVANLAYNTDFNIGIYDEISTTTNKEVNYYKIKATVKTTTLKYGKETVGEEKAELYCMDESKIVTETDTITYDIAYANTWIVEIWSKYTAKNFNSAVKEDETTMEGSNNDLSEDEIEEIMENQDEDAIEKIEPKENTTNNSLVMAEVEIEKVDVTKEETEELKVTKQEITSSSYYKGESEIKEKIDREKETGDNFIKALITSRDANHSLIASNGMDEWLCDIIEANEDTANMVDLTKALLTKAKDPNAEIDFDFSTMKPGSLNSMGGIYGNNIEEKVWFALINAGFSKESTAGVMGSIYYESRFISTAVNSSSGASGICQWLEGRKTGLQEYAASKGLEWTDENTQIEYLLAELGVHNNASDYIAGIRNAGAIPDYGLKSTKSQWENAKTVEEAAKHFEVYFESPGTYQDRSSIAKEYYEKFKDMEMPSEWSGGGQLNVTQGQGYRATYDFGGKTYKIYYQNYYPKGDGREWGAGKGLCLATAYAIVASGYGDTYTPNNFWNGSGAYAANGYTMRVISQKEVTTNLKNGIPVILFGCYGQKYYDSGGTHALILLDINSDGSEVYMLNTFYGDDSQKNGGWKKTSEILNFAAGNKNRGKYRVLSK